MIDFAPVAGFGLLLVRPAMVVMVAPGLGAMFVPAKVKVALAVFLALGMLPAVPLPPGAEPVGLVSVVLLGLQTAAAFR